MATSSLKKEPHSKSPPLMRREKKKIMQLYQKQPISQASHP